MDCSFGYQGDYLHEIVYKETKASWVSWEVQAPAARFSSQLSRQNCYKRVIKMLKYNDGKRKVVWGADIPCL